MFYQFVRDLIKKENLLRYKTKQKSAPMKKKSSSIDGLAVARGFTITKQMEIRKYQSLQYVQINRKS